jgi:hypothetical protein
MDSVLWFGISMTVIGVVGWIEAKWGLQWWCAPVLFGVGTVMVIWASVQP